MLSAPVRAALASAFGSPRVPAWVFVAFTQRIRDGRLVFSCSRCGAGHAFLVGERLSVVDRLGLENHKAMHDLNIDPLEHFSARRS